MLLQKITCPHCQSVLKSKKAVPNGVSLACPQCKKVFRAGEDLSSILSAAVPPPLAHGQRISAGPPPMTATMAPPRPFAAAAGPVIALRPGGHGKRLALVLGGLFLMAILGGVLLWLLTKGGAEPVPEDKVGGDLVLGGGSGPAPKPKPKPLIELTPEEEKVVREMTDKGVAWLRKMQRKDGTWAPYNGHHGAWPDGVTAMAGLTLLSCGVDPKDEAVQKAADRIRKTGATLNRTYELGLCILFLDKLADPRDEALLRTLAFRLVCGQSAQGGWTYTCAMLNGEKDQDAVWQALDQMGRMSQSLLQEGALETQEKERTRIVSELPKHLRGLGVFASPKEKADFFRGGGDNSNTQFGVLGLWAAKKNKLPVDRALQLAVKRFKESHNPDGSWSYDGKRVVIGEPTMTCAGLLAMAVEYGVRGKDELKGSRPEDNPAIKKGLAHVAKALNAPKDEKTKAGLPPLYFVWSVERVGMLFHLKDIDGKDWYRWGMRILKDHQTEEGRWNQGWHATTDTVDTCFALLFLNRVNLSEDLTDKLTEFGLSSGGPAVAPAPRAPGKD